MPNLYSLIAEMLMSNAQYDAARSNELAKQLYVEILSVNAVVEMVLTAASNLQPKVEKESSILN